MADGLVAALARCQARFPAIVKSHVNPAFKGSQYADVADVLAAVRPVLAAEGIALMQSTVITEDGGVALCTALRLGDESEESIFPLPVHGLTAQQVGSLLTYHRRYQLCALLGVHPVGDDDDGNLAATAQTVTSASSIRPMPDPYKTANVPPDDWETRPLASMTFGELRGVAEKLNHPFSGGSKSELIRQLEPLVRAASGAEPWPVEGEGESVAYLQASPVSGGVHASPTPSRPEPDAIPFEPTVFAGAAADSGTARRARDAAKADTT